MDCLTVFCSIGLPSGHISYVKNVKPGMPLFLFNYSDRKMHGIFEAASAGQLNIDQFAWSDGGRIKTQFPAQVLISVKTQCHPVPESQFRSVISDNYHRPRHFYFELDHAQTRALMSLFKPAPVHDVTNKWDPSKSLQYPTTKSYLNPGPTKSEPYTKDLGPFGVSSESHYVAPYKLPDPEGEYASASRTSSHLDDESSNWDDLDDVMTKEGTESVNDDHQHMNPPHEEFNDTVAIRRKLQELYVLRQQDTQSSNDAVDSASDKSMPQEAQFGAALPTDPLDSTPKADTPIEDLTSLGKCYGNAELLHIINELSKRTQTMEKQLRFAPAAAVFNSALYVTGGYDGNMYLQSAERYDPREGFWALLPSMNARRGSHSVAVLGDALYAVGGYDGSNRVSTVEIFDARANSWRIGSPFSIARGYGCAVTMDDNLFYIGGVNDAGETVNTVEVYNERQGWSMSGCQSVGGRAFACAITV
nr:unnamed protein product [Digitaria exilis]